MSECEHEFIMVNVPIVSYYNNGNPKVVTSRTIHICVNCKKGDNEIRIEQESAELKNQLRDATKKVDELKKKLEMERLKKIIDYQMRGQVMPDHMNDIIKAIQGEE